MLYRVAVSRWECGPDRVSDLLTKKLSEVLEVSLDELLSGEEMKNAWKNPIVESPVIGRVQSALYACRGSIFTYEHFCSDFNAELQEQT